MSSAAFAIAAPPERGKTHDGVAESLHLALQIHLHDHLVLNNQYPALSFIAPKVSHL
jgi:hypothetical protein